MGIPKTDGNNNNGNQYYKVIFNDSQNGKKVSYNIPIGSKIQITQNNYEVRADGVYQRGENNQFTKVDEVSVILGQRLALHEFDVNGDGRLDENDNDENSKQSVAYRIQDKLDRHGSRFYIPIVHTDDDGGFEYAGLGEGSFGACFYKKGYNLAGSDSNGNQYNGEDLLSRWINIETPEYIEKYGSDIDPAPPKKEGLLGWGFLGL